MGKTPSVDNFIATLTHARLDDIRALRRAILAADERITERIKWNAPSFCWQGEDRVTMRLQPGDRLQLVFHRGAKATSAETFRFEDTSGLMAWAAADRAVVTVDDLPGQSEAIIGLVRAWMIATAVEG